jgi:hypothetical protein
VEYIHKTCRDIDDLVGPLHDGDYADNIRRLHNLWEQMSTSPLLADPGAEFSVQEQLRLLTSVEQQCARMVVEIAYLTIPPRVNQWLEEARPGYYIPFHAVFEDELPNLDDRNRLLSFLGWSPEVLKGGLVDADAGVIYRYSVDPRRRLLSFALLLSAAAAALGVIFGLAYMPVDGWPLNSTHLTRLLLGWAAIFAGIVVHLGIGTAKRSQERGRPPIISIGDIPLLVNAKAGQVLLKILMTLVGLFGLAFAAGIDNVTPLNAFLIGYTLDSAVELFATGIEQRAARQLSTLRQLSGVDQQR